MPTNLYGEHDNFDREDSHVVPAMIRRFHDAMLAGAAEVVCWGTGTPRREFLHVDDMADASVHLMNVWGEPGADGQIVGGADALNQIVNIGYGDEVSIKDLAELVRDVVGYEGHLRWDTSKPDGTPRKLLDSSRLASSGWAPRIALREGIERTYAWFIAHNEEARLGGGVRA